jgi:hypothetical protein
MSTFDIVKWMAKLGHPKYANAKATLLARREALISKREFDRDQLIAIDRAIGDNMRAALDHCDRIGGNR